MRTIRLTTYMFFIALTTIGFSCKKSSDSTSASNHETIANGSESEESSEAIGNAQDENMPNTMASAAGEVIKTSFTGTIDGKIEASLELYQTEDVIRGTITYRKSGKPIMILGTEGEDGSLFLREYLPDGKITGILSGTRKGDNYSGSWYSNDKDLKLEMKVTDEMEDVEWPFDVSGSVAGEYAYHYPEESTGDPGAAGTLKVKQSGNKITFSFDCVNGPPAYSIATVEDTEAVLDGNRVDVKLSGLDCAFSIQFFKGFAIVHQKNGYIQCEFGNGAGIEGQYVKVR